MRSLLSCIFVRKLIIHQSASYGISFKKVVKWCNYINLGYSKEDAFYKAVENMVGEFENPETE